MCALHGVGHVCDSRDANVLGLSRDEYKQRRKKNRIGKSRKEARKKQERGVYLCVSVKLSLTASSFGPGSTRPSIHMYITAHTLLPYSTTSRKYHFPNHASSESSPVKSITLAGTRALGSGATSLSCRYSISIILHSMDSPPALSPSLQAPLYDLV